MKTEPLPSKEKKLRTLRRILWICFTAIAIPSMVFLRALYPMIDLSNFGNGFSAAALMVGPFLMIPGLGVVFVVIYYIIKYRLEKEEDLFL
jgi:hypothetical protein